MKEWIKQFDEETQKELYASAYDYMSYRKAYYNENLTVEDALRKIKNKLQNRMEAHLIKCEEIKND